MATPVILHLFYEEPDPDRWIRGDRHLRRYIRRILRGKPRPGGVMRWFLNLRAGLDLLGVTYCLNDYCSLASSPGSVAYVVGKPHVIDKIPPGHPIVYGPGIAAHPFENDFWDHAKIELILISCEWFKAMYDRDLPKAIPTAVWPAGVDTDRWRPSAGINKNKVLVYDKIRWRRDEYERELIAPILDSLSRQGFEVVVLCYGCYLEEEYEQLLKDVSSMVFLCEHETQGFAYLQALSCGVPIFAWDRAGMWQDPSMYPHRVRFEPVTSVPYFDERCGARFSDMPEFDRYSSVFFANVKNGCYRPRDYIVENFGLAQRAREYLQLIQQIPDRQ